MRDLLLLFAGAILGVIASRVDLYIRKKIIERRNDESKKSIPYYEPLNDDIILLRQWNSRDKLEESSTTILYNENKVYSSTNPTITCPFISNPKEWEDIYSRELKKEGKRTGTVSYVTDLSLDHKDTIRGQELRIEVSSCDYLAHHVNGKYLVNHPTDWERIKQTLHNGDLSDYFTHAMPGNVFVNFIVINGQTNNVLAIKRSNQELNARNIWGLSGFETMNNIANVANGSEELKLHGIVYRGLWEELATGKDEVSKIAISSLSFVKHLGIMVTALVRLDLMGNEDSMSTDNLSSLTEGGFIERVYSKSESRYEHSSLRWLPLNLTDLKQYIEDRSGYYQDILKTFDENDSNWISYAKLQMYQIWCNHDCIGIIL